MVAGIINEEEEDGEVDDQDTWEGDDDSDFDDEDSTDGEPEGPPLVYVLNLVNTKQDKTVKRGAIVKAMAICTRHPFLHIYKVREPPVYLERSIWLVDDANKLAALVTIGLGGILQVTSTGDASHALRLCKCHGPVFDAETHLP